MTSTPAHPNAAVSARDRLAQTFDKDNGSGSAGESAAHGQPDRRLTGAEPISGPRPISLLLYSDNLDTRARSG